MTHGQARAIVKVEAETEGMLSETRLPVIGVLGNLGVGFSKQLIFVREMSDPAHAMRYLW